MRQAQRLSLRLWKGCGHQIMWLGGQQGAVGAGTVQVCLCGLPAHVRCVVRSVQFGRPCGAGLRVGEGWLLARSVWKTPQRVPTPSGRCLDLLHSPHAFYLRLILLSKPDSSEVFPFSVSGNSILPIVAQYENFRVICNSSPSLAYHI